MGFRYVVRHAKPEDSGSILRLIKELTKFEGENPDQAVTNTEQDVLNGIFGDHALCHSLVVEATNDEKPSVETETGIVVAHAMYYYVFNARIGKLMFLEDIYIEPSYRGQGLGKALMSKLAQIGADNGCKGMEWTVKDFNTIGRQFYDRLNCVDMTAQGYRLMGSTGQRFIDLANLLKNSVSNNIHFLC